MTRISLDIVPASWVIINDRMKPEMATSGVPSGIPKEEVFNAAKRQVCGACIFKRPGCSFTRVTETGRGASRFIKLTAGDGLKGDNPRIASRKCASDQTINV